MDAICPQKYCSGFAGVESTFFSLQQLWLPCPEVLSPPWIAGIPWSRCFSLTLSFKGMTRDILVCQGDHSTAVGPGQSTGFYRATCGNANLS